MMVVLGNINPIKVSNLVVLREIYLSLKVNRISP